MHDDNDRRNLEATRDSTTASSQGMSGALLKHSDERRLLKDQMNKNFFSRRTLE
jgi:hypothetical protein